MDERTANLRETVRELEHFSYTMIHDMRAPLRAMQGFGDMLMDECADCLHPQPGISSGGLQTRPGGWTT